MKPIRRIKAIFSKQSKKNDPMIQKLRWQFVLVTMIGIGLLFIIMLGAINITMTLHSRNRGYDLLNRIADSPSKDMRDPLSSSNPSEDALNRPPFFQNHPAENIDDFDRFRSFSVLLSENGAIEEIFYHEASGLDEETITSLTERVLDGESSPGKKQGASGKYLYVYRDRGDKGQLYFLDYTVELEMMYQLVKICLPVGILGILVLFIAVFILSRLMVTPVQEAFDRQKQFIADASHELKTPLTIITANAEVLSAGLPDNKWLGNILEQSGRMNHLIKDLLELARLDTPIKPEEYLPFDLSRTVNNTALSFESMAYEKNRKFFCDITPGITLVGKEISIVQLITILLDNAFKYSDNSGRIDLSLKMHSEKKVLSVRNTGAGISPEEQRRIFERFYRCDSSRSRESGGYGLGLSIAASIAKRHKGSIQVHSDGKSYTEFIVTLP